MSEKRFKKMDTIIDPFPIWDTVEEKGYNCTDTLDLLVDLLNNLHQENQQLKHYKLYEDNKRLQTIIADLKEENEQLKREKAQLNERLRECYVRLDKYNCKW